MALLMGGRFRTALRLVAEVKRKRLPPVLVVRIILARFCSYGFRGLLQRFEYWTHQFGVDDSREQYAARMRKLATLGHSQIRKLREIASTTAGPRITILVLARGGSRYLRPAVESVLGQLYQNWELYVVCDASNRHAVQTLLLQYPAYMDRIYLAEDHAGIAVAANAALSEARGELVAVLRADGELRHDALLLMAGQLGDGSTPGVVYSDECTVDADGHIHGADFKPDWSPELLLGYNYIGACFLAQTDLLRKVGGFHAESGGVLEHDLILRLTGACEQNMIYHVPYLAYQQRVDPGASGAGVLAGEAAEERGRLAVQQHLSTIGRSAEVLPGPLKRTYRMRFPLPQPRPLVSIVVPTRNAPAVLRRCIESIFEKTDYEDFEVLIIDNETDEPEAREYLQQCAARPHVRVLAYNRPFNYPAINNFAVSQTAGEYLCLLNNDTEVITPEWLGELVMWASQPGIGAVGAKLLYSDNSIQHSGITLGVMGLAGHAYRGTAAEDAADVPLLAVAHEVGAVTGACLLVSRAHFDSVGGLDEEHLPVSYNDVDLCLRLRGMGLRNIWTPHASLYHHESRSRGRDDSRAKRERFEKEANYMLARWGPELLKDPMFNPNLSRNREDYALGWPPQVPPPAQYLKGLLKRGQQR